MQNFCLIETINQALTFFNLRILVTTNNFVYICYETIRTSHYEGYSCYKTY